MKQENAPVTRDEVGQIIREEWQKFLRERREALGDDAPATAEDLRQILREALHDAVAAPRGRGPSAT